MLDAELEEQHEFISQTIVALAVRTQTFGNVLRLSLPSDDSEMAARVYQRYL